MPTATTTRRATPPLPALKKRYLNTDEIVVTYGIPKWKLIKWRTANIGPPFRRFGHKIVLYEVDALERWILLQDEGGEQV